MSPTPTTRGVNCRMPTFLRAYRSRWGTFAALIVLLAGSLGLASAWANPAPTLHAITPSQISNAIAYYYQAYMQPESAQGFDLRKEVLRPHYLLAEGVCPGGTTNGSYLLLRRDNLRGQYIVACELLNGHHWTQFIPRDVFGYLPAARSMNFGPVLHGVGNRAAASAGIVANQHGPASEIVINKTKRSDEADIAYSSDRPVTGVKQLKELRLLAVKGHETVKVEWYRQ